MIPTDDYTTPNFLKARSLCFLWINCTLLESRLLEFYKTSPAISSRSSWGVTGSPDMRDNFQLCRIAQISQPTCIPGHSENKMRLPALALWGRIHGCSWGTWTSSDAGGYRNAILLIEREDESIQTFIKMGTLGTQVTFHPSWRYFRVAAPNHKRDVKTTEDGVEFHSGSQGFIFLLSVMNLIWHYMLITEISNSSIWKPGSTVSVPAARQTPLYFASSSSST